MQRMEGLFSTIGKAKENNPFFFLSFFFPLFQEGLQALILTKKKKKREGWGKEGLLL
jgi:hypothetical protein